MCIRDRYNAASIILMMRIDPLQVSTLDALRTQILSCLLYTSRCV